MNHLAPLLQALLEADSQSFGFSLSVLLWISRLLQAHQVPSTGCSRCQLPQECGGVLRTELVHPERYLVQRHDLQGRWETLLPPIPSLPERPAMEREHYHTLPIEAMAEDLETLTFLQDLGGNQGSKTQDVLSAQP